MNYGGYKYGNLSEELKADWRAQFKEWGEDTLREYMKDPDHPTSPGHPRHELAVEWLGKRANVYWTGTRIGIIGLILAVTSVVVAALVG